MYFPSRAAVENSLLPPSAHVRRMEIFSLMCAVLRAAFGLPTEAFYRFSQHTKCRKVANFIMRSAPK